MAIFIVIIGVSKPHVDSDLQQNVKINFGKWDNPVLSPCFVSHASSSSSPFLFLLFLYHPA